MITDRDYERGITLRVSQPRTVLRMVIDERPFVILNPMRCLPGKTYLVDVDERTLTATIHESFVEGGVSNPDWPQPNRDPDA
jgi:hypothetical protein